MKANNKLARRYINTHALEAARSIERLPAESAAALLASLDTESTARLLSHMLPHTAAAAVAQLDEQAAANALTAVKHVAAARILKAARPDAARALLARVEERDRQHIERLLAQEPDTVGAVMDAVSMALPRDISAAEGIKRIQHYQADSACGLFIVDHEHKLSGVLDPTALLKAGHNIPLHSLVTHPAAALPAGMKLHTALLHVGWQTSRCLPVVERDNTLVGVLEYRSLVALTGDGHADTARHDTVSGVLHLASLYWIAMAEVLDTVLGGRANVARRAGNHHD
jgi:magnesium transporter